MEENIPWGDLINTPLEPTKEQKDVIILCQKYPNFSQIEIRNIEAIKKELKIKAQQTRREQVADISRSRRREPLPSAVKEEWDIWDVLKHTPEGREAQHRVAKTLQLTELAKNHNTPQDTLIEIAKTNTGWTPEKTEIKYGAFIPSTLETTIKNQKLSKESIKEIYNFIEDKIKETQSDPEHNKLTSAYKTLKETLVENKNTPKELKNKHLITKENIPLPINKIEIALKTLKKEKASIPELEIALEMLTKASEQLKGTLKQRKSKITTKNYDI